MEGGRDLNPITWRIHYNRRA